MSVEIRRKPCGVGKSNAEKLRSLLAATDGEHRPELMECDYLAWSPIDDDDVHDLLAKIGSGELLVFSRERVKSILAELEATR